MRIRYGWAIFALLAACNDPNAGGALPKPLAGLAFGHIDDALTLSSDANTLAHDNRVGAVAIYDQLAPTSGSMVFSPWAIQQALGMFYAAAQETTATDMQTAMRWSLSPSDFASAYRTLSSVIATRVSHDPNVALQTVTRTWFNNKYTLASNYVAVLSDDFSAGPLPMNFINDPNGSRNTINTWVDQQTSGKIPTLLPPDSISPSTLVVQTAALHVQAAWTTPMVVGGNVTFHSSSGATPTVTMLTQSSSVLAVDDANNSAVQIPCGAQSSLALLVIMPKNATALDANGLDAVQASLHTQPVNLSLPRFTVAAGNSDISPVLVGLGMHVANTDVANFTFFTTPEEANMKQLFEQATISIDENGVQASAAAAGVAVIPTDAPANPLTLTFDQPFYFFLQDSQTHSILFMGRYDGP